MSRLNLLLLVALILSSLLLVRTAYETRRLFAEIEQAKAETSQLQAEFARLQAERHAQATNIRVERLARDKLQMLPITPAVTHYVGDAARSGASAPSPTSATPTTPAAAPRSTGAAP